MIAIYNTAHYLQGIRSNIVLVASQQQTYSEFVRHNGHKRSFPEFANEGATHARFFELFVFKHSLARFGQDSSPFITNTRRVGQDIDAGAGYEEQVARIKEAVETDLHALYDEILPIARDVLHERCLLHVATGESDHHLRAFAERREITFRFRGYEACEAAADALPDYTAKALLWELYYMVGASALLRMTLAAV
jgi:hypothetical protein